MIVGKNAVMGGIHCEVDWQQVWTSVKVYEEVIEVSGGIREGYRRTNGDS